MGEDPAPTGVLVWQQLSAWVWATECGRFKIERFIPGDHESVGHGFTWPDRYRILKRTPEWYFECAPPEAGLDAAKRACERVA